MFWNSADYRDSLPDKQRWGGKFPVEEAWETSAPDIPSYGFQAPGAPPSPIMSPTLILALRVHYTHSLKSPRGFINPATFLSDCKYMARASWIDLPGEALTLWRNPTVADQFSSLLSFRLQNNRHSATVPVSLIAALGTHREFTNHHMGRPGSLVSRYSS